MLLKLMTWLGKFALGGKIIDIVDGINERLSGHRTEIVAVLYAIIKLLEKFGVMPPGLAADADKLALGLLGALPITLAEKVGKANDILDSVAPTKAPIVP